MRLDQKNAEALWKKNEEMVGELLLKDDGMIVQVCGNARVRSKPEMIYWCIGVELGVRRRILHILSSNENHKFGWLQGLRK